MPVFTDQISRQVVIPDHPQRIISLVPSQTELLFDFDLDQEVIGITKFCVHPNQWFRSKTRIGGTKQLHINKIFTLKPDLIIANKEENLQAQVEQLMNDFPVWISNINNLESSFDMIQALGIITGKTEKASAIQSTISKGFQQLSTIENKARPKVCYLIWREPYMTIGSDTFIHDMLYKAGFNNAFADRKRYPIVTIEEIIAAQCDLLFLSSEPYPFSQKHIDELSYFIPASKFVLVDGEMFSWYGSRLMHAPNYFQNLWASINENKNYS